MKNPLTRRRERRILAALDALGELTEWEISGFIGTPRTFLRVPLLNLALDKKITATRQTGLLASDSFVWSITRQDDADE